MRVALDTSRLAHLFQGDTELAQRLGTCDEIWIPLVVLAEIRAGFYGGTQRHRNELKLAGTPVPDNDLWIAALTLEHDLILITRDQHFERIPQLLRG